MTEDQLQQKCVIEFRNRYQIKGLGLIFAVPNGGTRNILEAKKLKLTGQLAGVADLVVLLHQKTIFFELKTEKGVQSEVQKLFETNVTKLGFNYHIVKSVEQFIKILENEIKL
jgi:hypothetical protein